MDVPGTDPSAAGLGDLDAARASQGPLPAGIARRLLDRGRERLEAGEPAEALADFQRVVGHPDAALTAEAWLGSGDALFRLDAEPQALRAWEAVVHLPETPSAYRAWRQIAAARVRAADLAGALTAYREADRRAPSEDKAEIASRLGWLSKEMGQGRAAGRYFARSRGTGYPIGLAQVLVVVTVIVSLAAILEPGTTIADLFILDHGAVARGELWRLVTVTLLHAPGPAEAPWLSLHLFFNMYALYLIGPIVEATWGTRMFALFYVLTAAAASTASFLFSPGPAVGASGAIFGLVGVLLAGTRAHHPILDRRARAIVPQLVPIIILNLAIGFAAGGMIDNSAHIGGLLAGMWLGFVVPPGKVPTLRSVWQHPGGQPATMSPLLIAAGIVLLIAVVALGLAIGGAHI
jgi:membrane associated rhomboid family serine protease